VIVAVGRKSRGGDVDLVATDAASGVAAAIDCGWDLFDNDTLAASAGFIVFISPESN